MASGSRAGLGGRAARVTAVAAGRALTLSDLQRFMRHPAELFFRERLHVRFQEAESSVEEHEPFVLDALQRHSLTRELVEEALQVPESQRDRVLQSTCNVSCGGGFCRSELKRSGWPKPCWNLPASFWKTGSVPVSYGR